MGLMGDTMIALLLVMMMKIVITNICKDPGETNIAVSSSYHMLF